MGLNNKNNDIFSVFNCILPVIRYCVSRWGFVQYATWTSLEWKNIFLLKIFYLLNDYGLPLSVTCHQFSYTHTHTHTTHRHTHTHAHTHTHTPHTTQTTHTHHTHHTHTPTPTNTHTHTTHTHTHHTHTHTTHTNTPHTTNTHHTHTNTHTHSFICHWQYLQHMKVSLNNKFKM